MTHSATVELALRIQHTDYPLTHLGNGSCILRDNVTVPLGLALVVATVDGETSYRREVVQRQAGRVVRFGEFTEHDAQP